MQSLVFHQLSKSYAGVPALRGVDLTLAPGRVHGLMGENGAGKSTLIKLIAGVVQPDAGWVEKDGARLALTSPEAAMAAGFRIIHQELNIVAQVTVAENILLGQPMPRRMGMLIDWPALHSRAKAALDALGAGHIDTHSLAGDLGRGDRMLMRIATALVTDGACLYVLDEPTAALNAAESDLLFAVIARLRAKGAAILYVSHRMDEVMRLCDDITVLRDGTRVSTSSANTTTKEQVIRDMTGRALRDAYPPRYSALGRQVICATALSTDRLHDLNFTVQAGEILGLTGLGEAGQRDVLRLFLGLGRGRRGTLTFQGNPAPTSPPQAWAAGVALIPGERRAEGLAMDMSVRANAVLPHLARFGLMAHPKAEARATQTLTTRVALKSTGVDQPVGQLSGGNQQKVVFARALLGDPQLLLLEDPTRGVDVGARADIYALIREASARGCAVLLASTDLPELLGLCDRIMILRAGHQAALLNTGTLGPADLLARIYETEAQGETTC